MSWAKLDDGFYAHPKVLATSLAAIGMYCRALSYAARYATDGALERAIVLSFGAEAEVFALADELVRVKLWEVRGSGFAIHDFLSYNLSSKDAERERKAAKMRMRALRRRSPELRRTKAFVPDGTGRVLSESSSDLKGESERETKSDDFTTWYAAYPKKRKPEKARKAWHAQRSARPLLAAMLEVLGRQRASPEWRKDGGQFIPYPESYLNGHCWADDVGDSAPALVVIPRPPPAESVLARYKREGVL